MFSFKIERRLIVSPIVILVNFFFATIVYGAIYYMPDDFANLQAGMAEMAGGDTLIIRDGVYTGDVNIIDYNHYPPNGSPAAPTIIRAENVGKAIFDGEGVRELVSKTWSSSAKGSYITFDGLQFKNSSGSIFSLIYASYIKILNCSFVDASGDQADSFFFRYADHCLVEKSWAWGYGRYNFYFLDSEYIILRQCVVRKDSYSTSASRGNAGGFQIYNSSHVLLQNCIGVDGDQGNYYIGGSSGTPSVFWSAYNGGPVDDVHYMGCIALHNTSMRNMMASGGCTNLKYTNSVFWDSELGFWARNSGGNTVDHCVSGVTSGLDVDASLFRCDDDTGFSTSNSIAYGCQNRFGIWNGTSSHNALYANSTNYYSVVSTDSDLTTIDPTSGNARNGTAALKYLLRIETGSDLDGAASDGRDIGATIIYQYGKTGTMWGETGYDKLQDGTDGQAVAKLWPFPNEDLIRENMKAYSYDNGNLTGNRGFCADGKQLNGVDDITLTSYIWEYLGNPIPSEIYGNDTMQESDTTPPVISNTGSTTTATTATISWTTDESATGQVDYGATVDYGQQVTTSSSTSHQVTVTDLQPGTTYHYKITCFDSSGNTFESIDYSFTTQELDSGDDKNTVSSAVSTLQDFEDGILWVPGGSQDPTGNGRGWAFLDAGSNAAIQIDPSVGANNTGKSLKITFDSDNPQIYFRSNDKLTDRMPEAAGANRMSFYVRFPEGFPIQTLPFRYDTWQLGTFIHDPSDWSDTHAATYEDDHGIHHYYHRLTMEKVGNGWVKYIVTTQPDQANYSGSTVPPDISHYFDSFGRFYFHFGQEAGGPAVSRPFSIWIDEITFYHDDGSVGGEIHVGGQNDDGFDGEFIQDPVINAPKEFSIIAN